MPYLWEFTGMIYHDPTEANPNTRLPQAVIDMIPLRKRGKAMMKLQEIVGKTVKTVEVIKAEYGRTYNNYLCFTFTDGDTMMLYGGFPHDPRPSVEEMKKAPAFYTPEEIAARVLADEREIRKAREQREKEARLAYEKLKERFG